MARNFRNKNGRGAKSRDGLIIEKRDFKGGIPNKEKESVNSLLFNSKAFRDLQNIGNVEVKADPNTRAAQGGYPYNIINRSNKVIDAVYAGYPNIEGNILTRLQNSNTSQLLNYYDLVTVNFRLNYLYLCYKTSETTNHNNVAVNKELLKAFSEAISKAYSTMTTQLPYYTNKITAPGAPEIAGLTDTEAGLYGKMMGILHYQAVIQNAVSPLSKYIETMSLEQVAQDMSYRRESPLVTALFGLLRKKAFIATLNAIGTSIIGEYFDDNWYKQMNMLNFVPSRKSDAVVDPLITATCTTMIPRVKMAIPGGAGEEDVVYYDSNDLKTTGIFINPDSFETEGTTEEPATLLFEDVIYRLNRMLDISTILTWARKLNTDADTVGVLTTASAYYQQIVKLTEAANTILTKFTTSMTDVRTFIDKLENSGMVYWKKGMTIAIDKVKPFNPVYNVILHNMVAAYIGGSAEMFFDTNTQRWQCSTLWNKYTGVAEFDRMSGGSFLTFGLRKLNTSGLANTDTAMCLPVMFASELDTGYSKCVIVNRKGLTHTLTSQVLSSVLTDPILARLDPLSTGFKVKVPYVEINSLTFSDASDKYKCCSALFQLLQNLFGYGKVRYTSTTYYTNCDPDFVCFLDVQVEDVSNEMIQFCRNYSPFRVSTPDGKRTMGFGKAI